MTFTTGATVHHHHHHAVAPGESLMGECEPRNFLRPCLLLLLQEHPAHGYDLVERLHATFIDDTDAGGVYRTLRSFEREGLVRSTWSTSVSGPARRTYSLTPAGTESLRRQSETLEATHQLLHLFLDRCGTAMSRAAR